MNQTPPCKRELLLLKILESMIPEGITDEEKEYTLGTLSYIDVIGNDEKDLVMPLLFDNKSTDCFTSKGENEE